MSGCAVGAGVGGRVNSGLCSVEQGWEIVAGGGKGHQPAARMCQACTPPCPEFQVASEPICCLPLSTAGLGRKVGCGSSRGRRAAPQSSAFVRFWGRVCLHRSAQCKALPAPSSALYGMWCIPLQPGRGTGDFCCLLPGLPHATSPLAPAHPPTRLPKQTPSRKHPPTRPRKHPNTHQKP